MQTHEQNLKKLRALWTYARRDPDGLASDPQFRAFVYELTASELQSFAELHMVDADQLLDALIPPLRDYLFVVTDKEITLKQFEMQAVSWIMELSKQLCTVCQSNLVAHLRDCYPASDAPEKAVIRFNWNGCDREQILQWLYPQLETMAQKLRSDHGTFEVADLVQETALRIHKSLHNYQEGNFLGWCWTIMTRVASDLRKQQERAARILPMSAIETEGGEEFNRLENEPDLSEDADPLATVLERERQQVIREAINRLPKEQRDILNMYDFEGCSYQEIVHTLGLPLGTVKSRLNRARKALEKYLSQSHPEYFEESCAPRNQTLGGENL